MFITFTIPSVYTSTDAGPFNISGVTDTSDVVLLASGILKSQLLTGFTVDTSPHIIVSGTVASVGACTNEVTFELTLPTPTPTAEPTPTPTYSQTITPTPTAEPTPTPTEPICDITYNILIVTPTPTYSQTITPTPTPTPTEPICDITYNILPVDVPGDPVDCSEGMDVVFLVDYTGSMGAAINDIKSSISSIANTIQTESNNNYRLGLVTFDEHLSGTNSSYSSNSNYTSLPTSQKYINSGLNTQYQYPVFQWITAWEKMSVNNISSFTTQLNKLNGVVPLGNGNTTPEPSDMGVNLVATDNVSGYEYFADTFRSGVSKLIILITDATPSGNDDEYNQIDIDFVNTLTPQLYNHNIRVLLMTTSGNNVLYDLATGTNGLVSNGFSGTEIITAIEDICVQQ